jgi:Flp pilus assembly protein TadB
MHLPSRPVLALAAAVGVATIIVVSAYGADASPAAYVGFAATLAIIAWGVNRERDDL